MQTISLTKVIPAPIDTVFDEYTDHERLSDLPMVVSSKVTTPGRTEKNGLGFTVEILGRADPVFKAVFTGTFKNVLHQVAKRSVARAKREAA